MLSIYEQKEREEIICPKNSQRIRQHIELAQSAPFIAQQKNKYPFATEEFSSKTSNSHFGTTMYTSHERGCHATSINKVEPTQCVFELSENLTSK